MARSIRSINEALAVLDEASQESADEIRRLVARDYTNLKKTLSGYTPVIRQQIDDIKERSVQSLESARSSLQQTKDDVARTTRETVDRIDRSARQTPWNYIGGAAAASLLAGYLLGRSKRKELRP